MDSAIWSNALKLLRFDNGIDSVTYDSIISKMTRRSIMTDLSQSSSFLRATRMQSELP